MQTTQKKTRLDNADMLLKQNFWKATKLTVAAIGAVALTGVLITSMNFALTHFKHLRRTIKS